MKRIFGFNLSVKRREEMQRVIDEKKQSGELVSAASASWVVDMLIQKFIEGDVKVP